LVKTRINNGEFTERGLARMLGVSQPQIHNVLKGKRKLQNVLADQLLYKLGWDVVDLIENTDRQPYGGLQPFSRANPCDPAASGAQASRSVFRKAQGSELSSQAFITKSRAS